MDFNAFLNGFAIVVEPQNLLYCLIGVLIGMVIGVLPGLDRRLPSRSCCRSPTPSTPSRRSSCWPASTTAPSTAAPSPRCCCGYPARRPRWSPCSTASQMAKQGTAGTALGIAAIGSFVGSDRLDHRPDAAGSDRGRASPWTSARPSTPPWRCWACCWSPPSAAATKLKALIAGGPRPTAGHRWPRQLQRCERASPSAACSWPTASTSSPIAMGLFGLGEILYNLEQRHRKPLRRPPKSATSGRPGGPQAVVRRDRARLRHRLLPGRAARRRRDHASMVAYAMEKRRSKSRAVRQGRGGGRGRRRKRPTTPRRRRRSSRC